MKRLFLLSSLLIASAVFAQRNDAIIQTDQMQQAVARGAMIWDVRDEKS